MKHNQQLPLKKPKGKKMYQKLAIEKCTTIAGAYCFPSLFFSFLKPSLTLIHELKNDIIVQIALFNNN